MGLTILLDPMVQEIQHSVLYSSGMRVKTFLIPYFFINLQLLLTAFYYHLKLRSNTTLPFCIINLMDVLVSLYKS